MSKEAFENAATIPQEIDVKAIRTRMNMTQAAFASRFGFSASAVKDWEQKRRRPEAADRVLLTVIDKAPQAVLKALEAWLKQGVSWLPTSPYASKSIWLGFSHMQSDPGQMAAQKAAIYGENRAIKMVTTDPDTGAETIQYFNGIIESSHIENGELIIHTRITSNIIEVEE